MEQINLNKNVTIEFTPQQIKLVLDILKKQQYDIVSDVIDLIQSQIIEQVKQPRIPESHNGYGDETERLTEYKKIGKTLHE